MDLLNKTVTHMKWGTGTITAQDDAIVSIQFDEVTKKFVYPDAFEMHLTIQNEEDAAEFSAMIVEKEERQQQKLLEQQQHREQAQRKEQKRLQYERLATNHKLHPQSQLVFWCDEEEKQSVFKEWTLFSGAMKSGQNKGKPNKAVRLHQNSAVIITARAPKTSEQDRRILGLYMVKEGFYGKLGDDGFIPAHSQFRIQLSEQESAQLYFWNYYMNEKTPNKMAWSTGKYRYFLNEWTAQILRDIYVIKTTPQEKAEVKLFLQHFCKVNQISINNISPRSGVLTSISE